MWSCELQDGRGAGGGARPRRACDQDRASRRVPAGWAPPARGEPMNIALVKLSSLGDVVHALPVAATLRARLPGVRLSWIVERREATLLVGHPGLDEVLTVDTRLWRRARSARGIAGAAGAVGRLRRRLEAGRCDVALDLQGLLKSGLLVRLTRAPIRIGFNAGFCREPLSALFTNRRVTPPPEAAHVVDQYLALLEPLGVRERVVEFNLPSDPGAETRIDDFFAAAGLKPRNRVVVLNPGAGRRNKRWPTERFRALAMWLADEAAAHVLVVWGPGEEAAARAIVAEPATRRRGLGPGPTPHPPLAGPPPARPPLPRRTRPPPPAPAPGP